MTQSRQLAAIMFTDIVGYTALMGNNEQKAFELLRKNREIQKPIIEEFGGRWIKELGRWCYGQFSFGLQCRLCRHQDPGSLPNSNEFFFVSASTRVKWFLRMTIFLVMP